jgi:hypothetical protein
MVTIQPQSDALQPKNRWFQFTWRKLLVFIVLLAAGGFIGFAVCVQTIGDPLFWTTADYDKARYWQIRYAIAADPEHLLGKYLDEATKALNLEDVPWDDATDGTNYPGQFRIYHFRGFALYVRLDVPPPRDLPVSKRRWYAEDYPLPRPRLTYPPPRVQIDGISDGKERMKVFWKAVEESCERTNAEMNRGR